MSEIPLELFYNLTSEQNIKKTEIKIKEAMNMIISGYSREKIVHSFKNVEEGNVYYEIAKQRLRVKKKYSKWESLWFDSYSASYSTPENVGMYRSEILSGNKIVDIGCGAGMQSIFFSFNSKVRGIEIDRKRALMAVLNNKAYDGKVNVEQGNGLEVSVSRDEIIFSDPLRSVNAEERRMEDLIPSPLELIDKFDGRALGFVFDLPPMMKEKHLNVLKGEREYISENGNISRLTIYSIEGKEGITAVMLDKDVRFHREIIEMPKTTSSLKKYIYITDGAMFYSGLHGNHANEKGLSLIFKDNRRAFYTSDHLADFYGDRYLIMVETDYFKLINELKRLNAGKVFFRYPIEDYYTSKKNIEKELLGNQNVYILKFNQKLLLCKKV
ncbi:hypothetical protein [Caldiplasma sukawensis]